MTDQTRFRDKLLAVEPVAPAVRERIQQEIRAMLIRRLTTPRRIALFVITANAAASALLCGYLVVTESQLPPLARTGLAAGVLFALAWIVVLVRILRSGAVDIRRDGRRIAQMVWGFTILMVVFFLVLGMSRPDRVQGLMMITQSLVFLIGAAVYWLSYRIEEAELNIRERLLQLELQIAGLAEKR